VRDALFGSVDGCVIKVGSSASIEKRVHTTIFPRITRRRMIGKSQNFFRSLTNAQISIILVSSRQS
jgi:hypothetical protein